MVALTRRRGVARASILPKHAGGANLDVAAEFADAVTRKGEGRRVRSHPFSESILPGKRTANARPESPANPSSRLWMNSAPSKGGKGKRSEGNASGDGRRRPGARDGPLKDGAVAALHTSHQPSRVPSWLAPARNTFVRPGSGVSESTRDAARAKIVDADQSQGQGNALVSCTGTNAVPWGF